MADPPLAPRAGEDLRAARERLAWPLEQVAAELRIRLSYLQALEAGHINLLPGHAYALGFLRTYARALGLDSEEVVRRFKAEAGEVTKRTELAFPAPVPERGLPAGAVALLGVLLVVGAYAGWYRLSGEGRLPAETVTPVPARLAPLAEQAVPPVALAPVSPPQPAPPPPAVASSGEPVLAQPSVSPTSAAAASVTPMPPVPAVAAAPATPAPVAIPAVATPPDADTPRIVLRAKADAWVRVKDKAGPVLIDRVLHPGESIAVPLRPNLTLSLGNAGGTEIVVDGTPLPPLGVNGAVVKDLPADPDLLKEAKVVPMQAAARAPQPVARPQ